jgi:hypothetical protein
MGLVLGAWCWVLTDASDTLHRILHFLPFFCNFVQSGLPYFAICALSSLEFFV